MSWPRWRSEGLPVPWVALWTDEKHTVTPVAVPRGYAMYLDPHLDAKRRDENGVLWLDQLWQPTGEPIHGEYHSSRSRRSTERDDFRCQVCGGKCGRTWLLSPVADDATFAALLEGHPQVFVTQMPTCEDCWRTASELCPHLASAGFKFVEAERVSHNGYMGDVVGDDGITLTQGQVMSPELDMYRHRLIARSRVLAFVGEVREWAT